MKRLWFLSLVAVLVMAACGNGGGESGPGAQDNDANEPDTQAVSCTPEDSPMSVKAENTDFDTECLAALADEAFTIELVNSDDLPHNISILTSKGGESLFKGEIISAGQTTTYNVPPLSVGKYYFQCDLHPEMNGTFLVAG